MLYEYRCPECGAITDDFVVFIKEMKASVPCGQCGVEAPKTISRVRVKFGWVPLVDDRENPWEGTALDGVDGRNPLYHETKNATVDQGSHKPHGARKGSRGLVEGSTFP